MTLEGDSEISIELPDKFLRKESIMLGIGAGIESVEGLNGTEPGKRTAAAVSFGGGGDFGGGVRGALRRRCRPETPAAQAPGSRASIPSGSRSAASEPPDRGGARPAGACC